MDNLIGTFEEHETAILNFYKAAGKKFLFRGMHKKFEIQTLSPPINRPPRNSPFYAAALLDKVYSNLGATALRSNSFFITPRQHQAETYGDAFIVIPLTAYSYTWLLGISDLYTDRDLRFYATHYNREVDPFEAPSIERPVADIPEFLLWAARRGAPATVSNFLSKIGLNINAMLLEVDQVNAAFDKDAGFRAQLKKDVYEWYTHRLSERIRVNQSLDQVRIEEVILHCDQLLAIPAKYLEELKELVDASI